MSSAIRWARRQFRRPPSPPRQMPATGFTIIDPSQKVEEENHTWYMPGTFYPVRLGEIFQSRYQVIGKLGYGAYSTVWLCRDLEAHRYVALKVYERDSFQGRGEKQVYDHLNKVKSRHSGSTLIRSCLDAFEIHGSNGGWYQCLVHPPLAMNLHEVRMSHANHKLPKQVLKSTLIHMLLALDFLHSEAKVIHTDLQQKNILLKVEDEGILSDFERDELAHPSPRKIDGDRVIYMSRELGLSTNFGHPVLADFGEARFGADRYDGLIQPFLYRAPEVILQIPWTEKVDIWNVAVLAWDLFENKQMFNARDANGEDSDLHHLAEMIALLGPPPSGYLRRSPLVSEYFDEHEKLKVEIPSISLESSEENLEGEDKVGFLTFIRKMMQWVPEERQSAKELLQDPWLKSQND